MRGQHPGRAEDIVVTPTLADNGILISDDRSVIVLAREWHPVTVQIRTCLC